MVAAVRMPEFSGTGVDRGLARLRLKLGEVEPELVARSQGPVTSLFKELVDEAAEAGRIEVSDPEEATYTIYALMSTYITSFTLGNDFGVRLPSIEGLTSFCLAGLGASLDEDWFTSIDGRLRLPARPIKLDKTKGRARGARSGTKQAASAS
jgi:hypothetical protein